MSKKRNSLLLLNDIVNAMITIESYLSGYTENAFYNDRKTKDAVVRNFEFIGEASRQIPDEFKSLHSQVGMESSRRSS